MESATTTISILNDFSEYPSLRHCAISEDSGEEFYHTILNKRFKEALDKGQKLVIDLDYTAGYAPSFLDEAFGNLVYDFGLDEVKSRVKIISNQEPDWIEMLTKETYLQWEKRRIKKEAPKVTEAHEAWYRIIDGEIQYRKWNLPNLSLA